MCKAVGWSRAEGIVADLRHANLYAHTGIAMPDNLNNPYGVSRPCRGCEHWGGDVPNTLHASVCLRDGRTQVQANREHGCVFWLRAIGVDDEADEHRSR